MSRPQPDPNKPGRPATWTNRFAQQLFSGLPDRYDRLAEWLSFGQNRRWRAELTSHIAATSPEVVLDVCSGTAGVAIQIASRSHARVVGVDVSAEMLAVGASNVARAGLSHRIRLVKGRAEELPLADGCIDAVSFTYLFRYVEDPQGVLIELARVLRPGGVMASLEFGAPGREPWRTLWWCYTRLVLPVAGGLTGGRHWYEVGRFLGPSISKLYQRLSIEATVEAWQKAGFVEVAARPMSLGGGLVMWGRKSDD